MTVLLVVSRDQPDYFRRLRYAFADDPLMTVTFDRRYGPGAGDPAGPPWTGVERRRLDIGTELQRRGWAIVEVDERAGPRLRGLPGRAAPGAPPPSRPADRILVVEDDPVVLEMLGAVLESAGYAPMVTPDPREALALLATEPFDLLITDVTMPHLSGLQLLDKARAQNPDAAVLMMSAFGAAQLVQESFAKGAAEFIAKPFAVGPFLATVRDLLARRG